MKIKIRRSPTADTRTCDWEKVTKKQLETSSVQHIGDVQEGLIWIAKRILESAVKHDQTKLSHLQDFFSDFVTGFKIDKWWIMHQKEERHHFNRPELIQDDVNLIDVLEQIVDEVMAGLARSGVYRNEPLSDELLQKAYSNTSKLLIDAVEIMSPQEAEVFEYGIADCYMDQAENNPFGSVGGRDNRLSMEVPKYVAKGQEEAYLAGYRRGALQMYGPGWKTVEFSWKKAFTINNEEK